MVFQCVRRLGFEFREFRDDLKKRNIKGLNDKLGQFYHAEKTFPEKDIAICRQQLTEVCLGEVVSCLAEMTDKELVGLDAAQTDGNKRTLCHVMISILKSCPKTTSSLRYILSRSKELFPNLIKIVSNSPGSPIVMEIIIVIDFCLSVADAEDPIVELIIGYNILDVLYGALSYMQTTHCVNLCTWYVILSTVCWIYHTLAYNGPTRTLDVVEAHPLHQFLVDQFQIVNSGAIDDLLKKANAANNAEMFAYISKHMPDRESRRNVAPYFRKTETPSLRYRFLAGSPYRVFCSSSACHKEVNEDGVLKHCAACKLAQYCNRECQVYSWKYDNHKQDCIGRKK